MQNELNITPSDVRCIRLGPSNRWAASCFKDGWLVLGYREVPHDLAHACDWHAARALLEAETSWCQRTITRGLNELRDFYTLGSNCLWVTFVDGKLWWAFAEPDVHGLEGDEDRDGSRYRRVIGQWQSRDVLGRQLSFESLPNDLTKTRHYQRAVCRIGQEDYLVRAINGMAA